MASRYFINGGVNSNWDTSGNWSATDGGAASGVKPTASDDVFFTANSPSCVVNTAGVGLTINFTGYASTLTMTATLTISGSVTLVAAMTIAGAAGLSVGAAATLTSNGKIWPNALTLFGIVTHTLADNWDVDGLLTLGNATATVINGFQITASAGLTIGVTSSIISGTTNIILDGTGTVTGASTTGALRNNLTINTAGTITFAAQGFNYNTGTFTYTAGTIVVTEGCVLNNQAQPVTLNLNGITWKDFNFFGAVTITLTSNLAGRLLSLGTTTAATIINGFTIDISGGIRYNGTTGLISGTTILNVVATGTLDAPSITTGSVINPIVINVPGGTVTVTSLFRADLGKVSYTAGTVIAGNTWATGGSVPGRRHYPAYMPQRGRAIYAG